MSATGRNLIAAGILMLPVWTFFTMDDLRFYLLTIPSTVFFAVVTVACPVFFDRLPRQDGR